MSRLTDDQVYKYTYQPGASPTGRALVLNLILDLVLFFILIHFLIPNIQDFFGSFYMGDSVVAFSCKSTHKVLNTCNLA